MVYYHMGKRQPPLSLIAFFRACPDDAAAERRLIAQRWPDGIRCPRCGSERVQERTTHPTMPHRCRACRRFFSVRTGSTMENSKLGYQQWALAMYLLQGRKKGISSLALAAALGITQKSAWHLAHRLRVAWHEAPAPLAGTVEADETYIGGRERNRHWDKKGTKPKLPVVGAKSRETGQVTATVVPAVTKPATQAWVARHVSASARLFTDEAPVYVGAPVAEHRTVNHKRKQYVDGEVWTNGVESHWALMKRGYHGTYHWWSVKHMQRYVNEFAGRFNLRELAPWDQLAALVQGIVGQRLTYRELTRPVPQAGA